MPQFGFILLVVLSFTAITQSLELSRHPRDFSSLPDTYEKFVAGLPCLPALEKHVSLTLKPYRRAADDDEPECEPIGEIPEFPKLKDPAAERRLPYTEKLIKKANKIHRNSNNKPNKKHGDSDNKPDGKHGNSNNKPRRRSSRKYNDKLNLEPLSKRTQVCYLLFFTYFLPGMSCAYMLFPVVALIGFSVLCRSSAGSHRFK